jgi:hypothetical protein
MKSTYATELFVKLFGTMPKKRVEPQRTQPPESSVMIPKLPPEPGEKVIYHVAPRRKDNRWAVKKEGGAKPSAVCDTKEQAIEAARAFAQNLPWSQVVIHNRDGKIAQEFTYGEQPEPPPAKPRPVGEWRRVPKDDTETVGGVQDS